MKKIPIILSTLTVAAASTGSLVAALSGEAEGVLGKAAVTAVNTTSQARDSSKSEIIETGKYDRRIQIQRLNWNNDTVGLNIVIPEEGYYQHRLILAYRDFENGITEKMADERMKSLGEIDSSGWAIPLLDEVQTNSFAAMTQSLKMAGDLSKNKTDVIYFALEAREATWENGKIVWGNDSFWLRGKIDYRNCIHSQANVGIDDAYCSLRLVDDGYGGYSIKYQLRSVAAGEIEMPENEKVITWDEEWRELQIEKYNELTGKLAVLDENVRQAVSLMDSIGDGLGKLDKTLPQVAEVDGQIKGVKLAQTKLEDLRIYYNGLLGSGVKGEVEALKTENEQLKLEKTQLVTEKEALAGKNAELEAAKAEFEVKNRELETKNEEFLVKNQELEGKNGELQQEIERLQGELKKAESAVNGACSAGSGSTSGEEPSKGEAGGGGDTEDKVDGEEDNEGDDANDASNGGDGGGATGGGGDKNGEENIKGGNEAENGDKSEMLGNGAVTGQGSGETAGNRMNGALTEKRTLAAGRTEKADVASETKELVSAGEGVNAQDTRVESSSTQDVEVPNLGQVKANRGFWWWILPAAAVALGGASWRLMRRKRK